MLIFIMNLQEGDILCIGHLHQPTVSANYGTTLLHGGTLEPSTFSGTELVLTNICQKNMYIALSRGEIAGSKLVQ